MNTSFRRSLVKACVGACCLCVGPTPTVFSQDAPEQDEQALDESAADEKMPAADEEREEDIYEMEAMSEENSTGIGTEAETTGEHGEGPSRGLGLKVGLFARDDDNASIVGLLPMLDAWIALGKRWELQLDWGFALRAYSPEQGNGFTAFVVGNPQLQLLRKGELGRTSIVYGLGVTVPVYYVPDETDPDLYDFVVTSELASAITGRWDYWKWVPEHLTIAIPVQAFMVSEDHILLGGETALALSIPAGDFEDNSAELYWQIAGEFGFGWEAVRTGVRLQGAMAPMYKGDKLQLSFGPFVELEISGGHLGAEIRLNLDDPHGVFGAGDDDVWALFLGGGIDF